MTNVRSINAVRAYKENDNQLISPLEVIEDAKREIENGERVCDKMLILTLNSEGDGYELGFYASHLRTTEMICLLEAAKQMFLEDMGF